MANPKKNKVCVKCSYLQKDVNRMFCGKHGFYVDLDLAKRGTACAGMKEE